MGARWHLPNPPQPAHDKERLTQHQNHPKTAGPSHRTLPPPTHGVRRGSPKPGGPPSRGGWMGPGAPGANGKAREARGSNGNHPASRPPPRSPPPPAAHRRGPPKSQPLGINLRARRRRDEGNLPSLSSCQETQTETHSCSSLPRKPGAQPAAGALGAGLAPDAQTRRGRGVRAGRPPSPPKPLAFYFLQTHRKSVIWLQFPEDTGERGRGEREGRRWRGRQRERKGTEGVYGVGRREFMG